MLRVDVAIVGGGIAGALLAAVLQRRGRLCAVLERETVFRDRVRGEGLHPWGYRQAVALGLDSVVTAAGANPLPYWQGYRERLPVDPWRWDDDPENEYPEYSVHHPRFQDAAYAAAEAAGAVMIRPVSAKSIARSASGWTVHAERFNGQQFEITADLLVGADGRTSAVRQWLGIEAHTDSQHHRFGGMLLSGVELADDAVHAVGYNGGMAYLLPQGNGFARAYGGGADRAVDPLAADKTGGAYLDLIRSELPEGSLAAATLAGPLAFFSNADIVPERLTGSAAVLIGDAAGANDPSVGQGMSLTLRDIRELDELLQPGGDPQPALAEYERRRRHYHETCREHAKWIAALYNEDGPHLAERHERYTRARELDPTLGGFSFMYTRGPIGLTADAAAKAHFFGEDL